MGLSLAEKKKQKTGTATMESYIQFWQNPNSINLTIDQLNQIISMHGFKKLHKRPKKDLVEALSSIDLIVPYRSTLKENVSSFASLPLDQINTDVCSLQWNECSVQYVETVGSLSSNQICDVHEKEEEEIGSSVGKIKKKKKKKKKVTNVKWSGKKKRTARLRRSLKKLDTLVLAALVASGGGGSAPTAYSRASYSDGSC